MSNEVLIRCENVSKIFCRDLRKSLWYGVKDVADDFFRVNKNRKRAEFEPGESEMEVGRSEIESAEASAPISRADRLRPSEFWAVKDVSFEVKRGECLGLIGRNGAGKTTLLKMLNGLIKPDHGQIEMKGRIGALIALGAGFNPVLTGKENIYVNGSILGLSKKEIHSKLDAIMDFAEIQEAIDAPVRTYSSGMQVRLGFAVAAILIQPDVLLLDEVLAVGDIGFVIKCLNLVTKMAQNSAVIFVSHNVQFIGQFCTSTLLMERGQPLERFESSSEGISAYLDLFEVSVGLSGTGQAKISPKQIFQDNSTTIPQNRRFDPAKPINIEFSVDLSPGIDSAELVVYVIDGTTRPISVHRIYTDDFQRLRIASGSHQVVCSIGTLPLAPGKYSLIICAIESATNICLARLQGVLPFEISTAGEHSYDWTPFSQHATSTVTSH